MGSEGKGIQLKQQAVEWFVCTSAAHSKMSHSQHNKKQTPCLHRSLASASMQTRHRLQEKKKTAVKNRKRFGRKLFSKVRMCNQFGQVAPPVLY